jgi:hypothetical protein
VDFYWISPLKECSPLPPPVFVARPRSRAHLQRPASLQALYADQASFPAKISPLTFANFLVPSASLNHRGPSRFVTFSKSDTFSKMRGLAVVIRARKTSLLSPFAQGRVTTVTILFSLIKTSRGKLLVSERMRGGVSKLNGTLNRHE